MQRDDIEAIIFIFRITGSSTSGADAQQCYHPPVSLELLKLPDTYFPVLSRHGCNAVCTVTETGISASLSSHGIASKYRGDSNSKDLRMQGSADERSL